MAVVIDTSAVFATIMGEPERAGILKAVESQTLIAPISLPVEIGNALSAAFKRKTYSLEQALAAMMVYRRIDVGLKQINIEAAVRLSFELRIYAYDAYVLQCARETGGILLTLDKGQATAARQIHLPLMEIAK